MFRFLLLAIFLGLPSLLPAQVQVADPSIQVTTLMNIRPSAVRIARNPVNNALYYCTFGGQIYRILQSGGNYSDTLIASATHHRINYLQGMVFYGNKLYLVGNRKTPNTAGYGLVMRGTWQAGGTWAWDTLMKTSTYPSTATLFDHAFSGICITSDGDSLIICSGSRTDHGEVQTSNGLFPNTREVPLTNTILKLPVNAPATIILQNDSVQIQNSGYLFARGVRNTFDMAFLHNGDLIGSENSGDRDDPEELNLLRSGRHYGFPWRMGGNVTGQADPGYNPNNDVLINHASAAWNNGYFYNDPAYPSIPSGLTFTNPIRNFGPDADKFRNKTTGEIRDASDSGSSLYTFTPHRSPLGLTVDIGGTLSAPYTNGAFIMSYTKGSADSSGVVGNGIGPFLDPSEDLLHLALYKDASSTYTLVGSSRVDLQACKLEYSIVSPK